jgi:hypothetical protein
MRRRCHGLTTDDSCALCSQDPESLGHLLLQCSFSRSVWFQVMVGLGQLSLAPSRDDSLLEWWSRVPRLGPKALASKIRAILLLVLRAIWL